MDAEKNAIIASHTSPDDATNKAQHTHTPHTQSRLHPTASVLQLRQRVIGVSQRSRVRWRTARLTFQASHAPGATATSLGRSLIQARDQHFHHHHHHRDQLFLPPTPPASICCIPETPGCLCPPTTTFVHLYTCIALSSECVPYLPRRRSVLLTVDSQPCLRPPNTTTHHRSHGHHS